MTTVVVVRFCESRNPFARAYVPVVKGGFFDAENHNVIQPWLPRWPLVVVGPRPFCVVFSSEHEHSARERDTFFPYVRVSPSENLKVISQINC